MNLKCQEAAMKQLDQLFISDTHSILMCGPQSCGKSYLARWYSSKFEGGQIYQVDPNVNELRDMITYLFSVDKPSVICVENLDCGNNSAAQILLKTLEEPSDNIYYVVTCRNIKFIPDTIISRSVCVHVNPATSDDIIKYVNMKDPNEAYRIKESKFWPCIKTFDDVDTLLSMTVEEKRHIMSLPDMLISGKCISDIQWAIGHYPDNKIFKPEFAIRYIMSLTRNSFEKNICIQCLNSLAQSRIASHAVIAKFVMEYKYGRG